MSTGGNGDQASGVQPTWRGLHSILIRARLAAAREAQEQHARDRQWIERARQARVRARRS